MLSETFIHFAVKLGSFPSQPSSELNVSRHNCDAFSVYSAEVCVLEE